MDHLAWKEMPWEAYDSYHGTLPIHLGDYVSKFVEGDVREREEARDFFRQWPLDSRKLVGRLGAMPMFMRLLASVIEEDREDAEQEIDLLAGFVQFLPDYEDETSLYGGSQEDFRASIIEEARDVYALLFARLSHSRANVRLAAIRAFSTWQTIEELSGYCESEVADAICRLADDDNNTEVICGAIEFLVGGGRGTIDQFQKYKDAGNVRLRLTVAWAVAKLGGVQGNALCVEMLCRFSLASMFPIPEAIELLETLEHREKREIIQAAIRFRHDLGSAAQLTCLGVLLRMVDSFDEDNVFYAYRYLLDELYGRSPRPAQISAAVRELQKALVTQIATDDRIWNMTNRASSWKERLSRAGLPVTRSELGRYSV